MPERRFYTWNQPPTLIDRAYAHPGTAALSLAAILVGAGFILANFNLVGGAHLLEPLPAWLKLWLGATLIVGGSTSTYGLFRTWEALNKGWAVERLGWTLQLGAWGSFTVLLATLVPEAALTIPLMAGATVTAYLRLRALSLIEREARQLIKEAE